MTHDKFQAPDSLINFPHLRLLAKDRLNDPTNTPLTLRERVLLGHLLKLEGERIGDPQLAIQCSSTLSHRLETVGEPRFTALADFLDPNLGYLACYPTFLMRVARYLLDWDNTQAQEHTRFNWGHLRARWPDLF